MMIKTGRTRINVKFISFRKDSDHQIDGILRFARDLISKLARKVPQCQSNCIAPVQTWSGLSLWWKAIQTWDGFKAEDFARPGIQLSGYQLPGLDHLQALWGKSMYEFWGDLITDAIAKDSALWGRLLLRKMPHPHAFFLLLLLEQVYVSVRGWGRNIQACLPANQIRILYLPCLKIAHLTLEDVKAGKIKFLVNCASQAPGFGLGRWETCILWYPDINCWLGIEI